MILPPYADHYYDAVTIAGQVVGVALVWSRSFASRTATAIFTGAFAVVAPLPAIMPDLAAIAAG